MSEYMTVIDHESCMKCSRCATVCPMDRMRLAQGKMQVTTDPAHFCIGCGHCMSVCPTQSITSAGMDYADFDDLPDKVASLDDILPLLKARRSMRHFTNQPVPRDVIEKVLNVATTAPMGFPPSPVEVIVLDSREKIEPVIPLVLDELKKWEKGFGNPLMKNVFGLFMGKDTVHLMTTLVLPAVRLIMEASEKGRDHLTYGAPVLIICHGDKSLIGNGGDIYIALTYAMLAAEASGLGTCWSGMIPPAIDGSKKLKEKLGIPAENKVVGSMMMGWPKVTYNRSVPRKFKSVKWL